MILAQTLDKILSTHYSLRARYAVLPTGESCILTNFLLSRCSRVCEAVAAVLKNRVSLSVPSCGVAITCLYHLRLTLVPLT